MAKRALEGIKIVEFAYIGITPMTAKLLGMNGATVVRVESKTRPDPLRTSGPFVDGIQSLEHGAEFIHVHSDKFGIALNLKMPKAVQVAKRLCNWADIVADGFTTGALERMGLGYEEIKKTNTGVIYFSCNTFGQTSPLANFPSTGIQLTGLTGFIQPSGWPDRGPVSLGYYSDHIVPHFNLLTIMAALDYKRRTGEGQHIDISQYEATLYFDASMLMDYAVNNRYPARMGNSAPNAAPHGIYRCQGDQKWCAIAVFTDEEWKSFCQAIGSLAWTGDPKFATLLSRKKNEEDLNRLVEQWTAKHPAEKVQTLLQEAGVAAGAVQSGEEVFKDPQFNHYPYFWWIYYPGIDKKLPTTFPFVKLSKTPAEVRMPRPMIGEHNEYICSHLLGMSDEEFVSLLSEGIFE